jgi:nitrous oxidase accessory protein
MHSLAAILAALFLLYGNASAQQTIVVSRTGDFRSVAAAVAAARPHDRILVKAGTYREPTIVVAKPLEIIGEGWPVLDGQGARQIMTITADSVTIRGIRFEHVGASFVEDWAAVKVLNADACTIEDNVIDDALFGIYLARASGCSIKRNRIHASRGAKWFQGTEYISGNRTTSPLQTTG